MSSSVRVRCCARTDTSTIGAISRTTAAQRRSWTSECRLSTVRLSLCPTCRSPSAPHRPTLLEEGGDRVAEILARITPLDQVVIRTGGQAPVRGNPPKHLLGRPDRQRRVAGNLRRQV